MIVIDDDIAQGGGIHDHEYSSNESKEEKIGVEVEVEEGYDDCDGEEGADVEEKEKQLQ